MEFHLRSIRHAKNLEIQIENFSRMERALYLWRPTPDVNSFGVSTLVF